MMFVYTIMYGKDIDELKKRHLVKGKNFPLQKTDLKMLVLNKFSWF